MSYKISAITYTWNNHVCYLGKIKYTDLNKIVDIKSDLSMNRDIDENRVDKVMEYLENEEVYNAFFPPAILSSSVKMSYEPQENVLEMREGKFTVIDGQHRIKAIIQSINKSESEIRKRFNNMELPVLIIEGLEVYQHRNLFSLINETAKKVDSNISERFSEKLENLIGLKFLSENLSLSKNIEWEKKQSFDETKIAYIHLTDCIRELHKELYSHLKDHLPKEVDLLYKSKDYYEIMSSFLKTMLEYIFTLSGDERKFFTKKITLRAIVLDICEEIGFLFKSIRASSLELEKCSSLIQMKIKDSFTFTLNKPVIEYTGELGTKLNTYKTRRHFLIMNGFINLQNMDIKDTRPLIQTIVDSYYSSEKSLSLTSKDYQSFFSILNYLKKNHELVKEIKESVLESISIDQKHHDLDNFVALIEKETN